MMAKNIPIRIAFSVFMMLLVLAAAGLLPERAAAHSFAAKAPAQQLILKLSPSLIRLEYKVEVPTTLVMEAFYVALRGQPPTKEADAAFTKTQLAGFLDGLTLNVDGKRIQWRDATNSKERNGVGNMNYFAYHLELESPWRPEPGREHVVAIENSNFDSVPGYFEHQLWKMGGIRVVDASFFHDTSGTPLPGAPEWRRRIGDVPIRVRVRTSKGGEMHWMPVVKAR